MLYPLIFRPIFKERVWGGRQLETLYQKPLPGHVLIGESWEITDRPEGTSVIENGLLAGQDLGWLMKQHQAELLGNAKALDGRFPLLIKILDAAERLSLQVHPPVALAGSLGGEPKTEMWYIAKAMPGAELFVGLKRGVDQSEFRSKALDGTVAECFHRVPVQTGDAMFLPSGRVHAIGGGNVIFEIQQNSDTTYRVFDWNRVGLDGSPRELHIPESLASIDFNDFEPSLIAGSFRESGGIRRKILVEDPLFSVNLLEVSPRERFAIDLSVALCLGIVEGRMLINHGGHRLRLGPGQFCLLPACLRKVEILAESKVRYLEASPGPTLD